MPRTARSKLISCEASHKCLLFCFQTDWVVPRLLVVRDAVAAHQAHDLASCDISCTVRIALSAICRKHTRPVNLGLRRRILFDVRTGTTPAGATSFRYSIRFKQRPNALVPGIVRDITGASRSYSGTKNWQCAHQAYHSQVRPFSWYVPARERDPPIYSQAISTCFH